MKVEVVIDHEQNEKKVIIKTNVHDATVDKILAALNNIDSLELYIDKLGKLSISILVKSDVKDYNEVIILN